MMLLLFMDDIMNKGVTSVSVLLLLLNVSVYNSETFIQMRSKNKDRFWMFDEFWESSWNPSKYEEQNTFELNREQFTLWVSNYNSWSDWSLCDPVKCTQTRYRMCKDDYWKRWIININFQIMCPVRFIVKVRKCKGYIKCKRDSMTNYPTDTLPKECGKIPKSIEKLQMTDGDAIPRSWPWNAALFLKGSYDSLEYTCGATILNHGWAITASECLRPLDQTRNMIERHVIDTRKWGIYDDLELRINDHDRIVIESSERTQRISHILLHPDYGVDVVLLKMDDERNRDSNTVFPCMSGYVANSSSECYMVGWNKNKFQIPFYFWKLKFSLKTDQFEPRVKKFKQKYTSILQQIKVSVVEIKKCKKSFPNFYLNSSLHICATTRSKKSCRGDSGGGLFCQNPKNGQWYLQGISNFVEYQGCDNEFEVYVSISSILTWIKETIVFDFAKAKKVQ